jgi:TRAP-type mannitol/chloroaromatic compound transport system permease small subunit
VETLFTISRILDRIVSFVGRAGVWLILVLMLVIVSDVVLRRWFVIGSTKLQELEWHLHGALFLICLGWAYLKNTHVRIELMSERWSNRTAAKVELVGCLLLLVPYVTAILIFSFDYVGYSFRYNEASASATGLPYRWIIKSVIPFGFAMLGLAALSRMFDSVLYLFAPKALAQQTYFHSRQPNVGAS